MNDRARRGVDQMNRDVRRVGREIVSRGESKHTPGPWEAYESHPMARRDNQYAEWVVYATNAEGGDAANMMPAECGGRDAEANAHLIAAAPDGYSVALHAHNLICAWVDDESIGLTENDADGVLTELRAFVAKATGGTGHGE